LYDVAGRKVIKLHGSITNLASMVATESDYKKRLEELSKNVMGGLVRTLLSTKTVVFIGYSLRDWNFRRLYEALLEDMDAFAPRAYFVSPFGADPADEERFRLTTLKTSGVRFIRDLKQANYGQCFIKDSNYARVSMYQAAISRATANATKVSHKEYPAVIYCWFFHDGARDACFRIWSRGASGEYSSRAYLTRVIDNYMRLAEEAQREERFWDNAYIEGYLTPFYVMLDDFEDQWDTVGSMLDKSSHYFIYGSDGSLRTEEEFRTALEQSRRRTPRQRAIAREITKNLPEGIISMHEPFLPGIPDENEYLRDEDLTCR
jgi:hypothetical protein